MSNRQRIAFVVYNDVYRDSRVLKTADSAQEAGFDARIYAFGGPLSHYPAGVERRPSGAEIVRLDILPDRLPLMSRLVDILRARRAANPAAVAAPGVAAPAGTSSLSPSAVSARASVFVRVSRATQRLQLRLFGAMRSMDFQRRAVRSIRGWQPDLVHAHDANTLGVAMQVKKRSGVPFVYDAHELWEERNAQRTAGQKRKERRLLDAATKVMAGSITVSPSIQDWMTQRYDLVESPILVRNIPLARTSIAAPEQGMLRSLAGLPSDARIVAYVGGITTGRGIDEAIESLALLSEDIHLVLLGQGTPANIAMFTAHAARRGVSDRVHFAGSVESEQVSTAAADADVSLVFTQPKNLSYTFSLPNKLFESIHAGLPVVASALPDVSALVTHYGVGELAAPDDIASMADAIQRVLEKTDVYREKSRLAADDLTWEGEMERLFTLYNRVLQRPATTDVDGEKH